MEPERIKEILNRLPTIEEQPEPPESVLKISHSDNWERRLSGLGFPLRHLRYPPPSPSGEFMVALERIKQRLDDPKGSLVILQGIKGTGKTQLAVSAAAGFKYEPQNPLSGKWNNPAPRYVKVSDIFRDIRSTYSKASEDSESEIFKGFIKPKLLIIDEAQERGETEFEDRALIHIIDKRYDALLHTIIISNLTKDALGKSLGTSIVSRLHETGEVIECNWKSWREK